MSAPDASVGLHAAPAGDETPHVVVPPPGPRSRALADRLGEVECPAFGVRRARRAAAADTEMGPIVLSAGRGSNLWDVDGNRYVDLAAGFGAVLLGHGAPAVGAALAAQAEQLVQGLGDVYATETKLLLLERLAALHPGPRPQVLLGQSGSDAVTAALKTATLATGRPGFIAFDGAYHGLGYGPLPMCGFSRSFREPFGAQLNPHTRFAPYPGVRGAGVEASLAFVEAELRAGDVAAVLVEPVLGRGGCVVPPAGFLRELCALAHHRGAIVIADEIWTGLGRCGSLSSSVAQGAPVDVLCFGKGLGGGLPVSACVASEVVMRAWGNVDGVIHTSTHAGAPLACAAALATLDAVQAGGVAERATAVGAALVDRLRARLDGQAGFVEARGRGLMVGVELDDGARALGVTRALLRRGYVVVTGGLRGEVLTLTPPLTISEALLDGFVEALAASLGPR